MRTLILVQIEEVSFLTTLLPVRVHNGHGPMVLGGGIPTRPILVLTVVETVKNHQFNSRVTVKRRSHVYISS